MPRCFVVRFDIVLPGLLLLQRCSQIFRNKVKGVAVAKGIAFPTCVSVNECVTNNSPLESEASKHVSKEKGRGGGSCG